MKVPQAKSKEVWRITNQQGDQRKPFHVGSRKQLSRDQRTKIRCNFTVLARKDTPFLFSFPLFSDYD
jgi:hypothetical protein